jgi:hypothetical protein
MTENRGQMTEDREQKADYGEQRTDDKGQMTEGRWPKTNKSGLILYMHQQNTIKKGHDENDEYAKYSCDFSALFFLQ